MGAVLAFSSAMVYGVGDFLGGLAARRLRALVVAAWSQLVGLVAIGVLTLAVLPTTHPTGADVAWGVAGGIVGAAGLLLLYSALASGPMTVAAPITVVFSALVPAAVGVVLGDRPGLLAAVGVLIALPAIVCIAQGEQVDGQPTHGRATVRALLPAFGAGLGFGLFFVCLGQTSADAGLWPLLGARTVSMIGLFGLALVMPGAIGLAHGTRRIVVLCGLCDAGANALFLASVNRSLLSLVAVLAALYPASTVVLAWLVLHERMRRVQVVGLALAAVAAMLVAGSS